MPRTTPNLLSDTVAALSDVPGGNVPDVGFPESELRNWGQYSPYIPVAPYVPPPPGCTINQVSSHPVSLSTYKLTHHGLR